MFIIGVIFGFVASLIAKEYGIHKQGKKWLDDSKDNNDRSRKMLEDAIVHYEAAIVLEKSAEDNNTKQLQNLKDAIQKLDDAQVFYDEAERYLASVKNNF